LGTKLYILGVPGTGVLHVSPEFQASTSFEVLI
jgi:hypothetical protein